MKTFTIGQKISFATAALVLFTVLIGTVSSVGISRMNSSTRGITEGPLPGIYSLGLIIGYGKDQKVAVLQHILATNAEQKTREEEAVSSLETKFQAEVQQYQKTVQTAQGREEIEKLLPAQANFMHVWSQIQTLSRAGKTSEALELWNGTGAAALEQRARAFDEALSYRRGRGEELGKTAIALGEAARFWSFCVLAFAVVAGCALAFLIVRGVNNVLKQAITELSEGSEQVSSASGQVSGSSQSLAQGASEQAASLQETSASSQQLASMTRRNAENSQQAASVMNTMSQRVGDANRTLLEMAKSMGEIGESSNKISRIIRVIDEIAFQTNILALNAAVEAARAGEAGMGFAVVAEEVRNLAQRSAQAAKDTSSLIEESIAKSGEGSRTLTEVAKSIEAITEGATQVKTLVDEVDASSREQAKGIDQIAKAISQMETVTQSTAASAEESASASEELSAQSLALQDVVSRLQLLVGAESRAASRPVHVGNKVHAIARSARRAPASAAVSAGKSEFPLDDTEFKEF